MLLVVVGFVVLIVLLRKKKSTRDSSELEYTLPRFRAFMQSTGYAFADARQAPIEAHVQRWRDVFERENGRACDDPMVRHYHGIDILWRRQTTYAGNTKTYSQSWQALVQPPPRLHFHISERTNSSNVGKGWAPQFQQNISTGDPQLDGRFVVFTPHDPRAVQAVIANPQFKQALLSFAYVDLRVTAEGVTLSDPMDRNLGALTNNDRQVAIFAGARFERGLPLHEQAASFLLGAASLAR